jgi:hypothetical protein
MGRARRPLTRRYVACILGAGAVGTEIADGVSTTSGRPEGPSARSLRASRRLPWQAGGAPSHPAALRHSIGRAAPRAHLVVRMLAVAPAVDLSATVRLPARCAHALALSEKPGSDPPPAHDPRLRRLRLQAEAPKELGPLDQGCLCLAPVVADRDKIVA